MKYLKYEMEDGSLIYVTSNIIDSISDSKDYELFEEKEYNSYISKMGTTIKSEMSKMNSLIKEVVEAIVNKDNSPNEIELEFGIAFSATMGIVITSGEMETNFKIKTIWKKESN